MTPVGAPSLDEAVETVPLFLAEAVSSAPPDTPPALAQGTITAQPPWRGFALAAGLHLLVLGALLFLLRPYPLRPAPDQPVIAMLMESQPAATRRTQPAMPAAQPVAKPAEAALPVPPPPAPPIPAVLQPAMLALPKPEHQRHPAPRLAALPAVPHLQPAHAAAMAAAPPMAVSTIPAQPDPNSNNPPPDYPWLSRERGEEGQVLLSIHIAPDGLPAAVTVAASSGFPLLDSAARAAVLHWHFHPALTNGHPAASTLPFWVSFRLQ